MSKKSNPTLIGAFVVGGVLLLAIGAAIFGGAELLAPRIAYVAYFTEDTKGLRVGSNVVMNGVQVGYVSKIALLVDQDDFESKTEVTLEILPESFIVTERGVIVDQGPEAQISHRELVNTGGLRALLQAESFVTGQLLVELSFRPDTEAIMRGGDEPPYPEIPTIPSRIQELLAKIQTWIADLSEQFDAEEFATRIENILRGVDELVNSEDVRGTLAGINTLVNREEMQQLSTTLDATLDELRAAARDAGTFLRNTDTTVNENIKPAIARLEGSLSEAEQVLAAAKAQLSGDSAQAYQLAETLREVESAARAVRELADYLERNPEAVLKGKKR